MDTTKPPLKCERWRELIWPYDHFRALTTRDRETGGPAATSGKVGHKACDFLGLLVGALAISGYPWGGQLKQIEALAAGPCRYAEGSFDFWVSGPCS
jgi:hypothetical protein